MEISQEKELSWIRICFIFLDILHFHCMVMIHNVNQRVEGISPHDNVYLCYLVFREG